MAFSGRKTLSINHMLHKFFKPGYPRQDLFLLLGMQFSKSIVNAIFVLHHSQTQINRPSLNGQSSENFSLTFGLLIIVLQITLYSSTF